MRVTQRPAKSLPVALLALLGVRTNLLTNVHLHHAQVPGVGGSSPLFILPYKGERPHGSRAFRVRCIFSQRIARPSFLAIGRSRIPSKEFRLLFLKIFGKSLLPICQNHTHHRKCDKPIGVMEYPQFPRFVVPENSSECHRCNKS